MSLDIAIAGCGPGGMAAASMLSAQGHRVTIFERFERPGPVGSGLLIQPVGLAVLDALGLGGAIRAHGAPIEELHGLSVPSGRRALDVRYAALGEGVCAYGVHRARLFATLHEAVLAAGVPIEHGREITGSAHDGVRRRLVFAGGAESQGFDLIVDATGARSPLAPPCGRALGYGALWTTVRWVDGHGARPAMLDQRYRAARQMAGILPVGRGEAAYFWSLRAADHDAFRARGLAGWRAAALALWPDSALFVEQIDTLDRFTFARYAHRTLPTPVSPALVHLGDAWHSTSPQLGQGANMALLDAAALATALGEERPLHARLARYARLRRGHVRLYQAMSALFTPLYQSDSAALALMRDRLVDPLAGWWPARPLLAQMVSGRFGLGSTRQVLASTSIRPALA